MTDLPDNPAQALPAERAVLAAAKDAAVLPALVALVALIRSPVIPREEKAQLALRALAIAQVNKAPATGQLAFDLDARMSATADIEKKGVFRRIASPMLTQAPYADDPQARAALRLFLADSDRKGWDKAASAWLEQVVDDTALSASDPLKVGALIRLASMAQQRGDEAAAKAAFARSGLAANQCALVDDAPKLLKVGGTFPTEAQAWGFEGWTRTQFDVAADGKVIGSRAIVSYPPFIFTKAGVATLNSAWFSKSYRPDGGLACGANTQNVKFMLPNG